MSVTQAYRYVSALMQKLLGMYAPELYGAKGDGATDDSAAIQRMFAAAPTGAMIRLSRTYYLGSGVSTAKQFSIVGGGGLTKTRGQATGFVVNATSMTALTIGASGTVLRDFAIINASTATQTAGSGILVTAASFMKIDNVSVDGFWNGIQVDEGYYYSIKDSRVINPTNYGIFMRNTAAGEFDHGDQTVEGCTITRYGSTLNATGTAVYWTSGGGLRFVNNKINGATQPGYTSTGRFQFGAYASVADGGGTSVLIITGNSIENCTLQNVRIDQAGTSGQFSKVVVVGNEIAIGDTGVYVTSATAGMIADVNVGGNIFTDLGTSIYTQRCAGVTIGPNHHTNVSVQAICIEAGTTNVSLSKQTVVGDNRIVVFDNTVGNTNAGPFATTTGDYDREIPTTTSSAAYTALYNLQMPQNSAGILDLTLAGYVAGVGSFTLQAKRTWQTGTGAVTVATVGADTVVGAAVDVAFDTTTTAGWALVKVKLNAAGAGTSLVGRCRLSISGPMYKVRKGT